MPLLSTAEIAQIIGANRETVRKRAAQLALKPGKGSHAKKQLYESRDLLMLIPDPGDDNIRRKVEVSLTEARIRAELAKAEKFEIDNETSRGIRVPIDDALDVWEEGLAMIREEIDASDLTQEQKDRIFDNLRKIAKDL